MKLTENGLVLVAVADFMQISFNHLLTALDEEPRDQQSDCGRVAHITGYTEWLSDGYPQLTVGWDWILDERGQGHAPNRLGPPRTNVKLIDLDGQVLPWDANLQKLGQLIDAHLPWQQTVSGLEPVPRYLKN